MELFHEYKNRYFNLVFKLLNLSQRGLSREEIISLIDQEEYDEKLIYKNLVTFEGMLLNECDEEDRLNLLTEENDKFYPIIKNNKSLALSVRLSTIEKQWLKSMISDDMVRELLGEEIINKLENKLANVESISKDVIEKTNKITYDKKNYSVLKDKFFLLIDSIKRNKIIKYTSVDKMGNEYKDILALPIRIDYSLKDENIRVSVYSLVEKRSIMLLLSNVKEIEILEDMQVDIKRSDIIDNLKQKKYCKEPIVLEVTDIKGAMARCFMGFSSYERSTRSLGDNKYEVKIFYYTFNKDEMIRKILTLGPYVVVKSPENIRNDIIDILKKRVLYLNDE